MICELCGMENYREGDLHPCCRFALDRGDPDCGPCRGFRNRPENWRLAELADTLDPSPLRRFLNQQRKGSHHGTNS